MQNIETVFEAVFSPLTLSGGKTAFSFQVPPECRNRVALPRALPASLEVTYAHLLINHPNVKPVVREVTRRAGLPLRRGGRFFGLPAGFPRNDHHTVRRVGTSPEEPLQRDPRSEGSPAYQRRARPGPLCQPPPLSLSTTARVIVNQRAA